MMIKYENGRIWQESMKISRYCDSQQNYQFVSNLSNFNHVLKYVLADFLNLTFTIKFVQ